MLRSVSHEFRTPLNAVLGFATLLLDTESTERRRRQLQEIAHERIMLTLEIIHMLLKRFSWYKARQENVMEKVKR